MGKAKSRRRRGNGTPTLRPLPSLLADGPPDQRKINQTAMRGEWLDPDDLRPNVRTGRTVSGHRAYCPLRWCLRRHGARSSFSKDHIVAADKLRGYFDGARLGYGGLMDWMPITAKLYRPMLGPDRRSLRQWQARRQFDRAWSLFDDPARAMLASVVLMNVAVGPTAETLGITKAQATERLVAALERLCEHWDIRESSRRAA
jgi:hypothetical protein